MTRKNHLKLVVDNPTGEIERTEIPSVVVGQVETAPEKAKKSGGMIAKLATKARKAGESIDDALVKVPGSRRAVKQISEVLRTHAAENSVAKNSNFVIQDLFDKPIAEKSGSLGNRRTLNTIIIAKNRRVYGVVNKIDHTDILRSVSLVRLPFGEDSVLPNEVASSRARLVREVNTASMARRGEEHATISSGDGFNVRISRIAEELAILGDDPEGVVAMSHSTFDALEENYPMANEWRAQLEENPHMWASIEI